MSKFSDISDSDSDSESSYCDATCGGKHFRVDSTSPIRRRVGIHMPDPPPTLEPPSPRSSHPASPALSDFSDIRCSTALSMCKDIEDNNNEESSIIDEAPPGDNIVTQVRWIIFYTKRKVKKLCCFFTILD